MFSIWEGRSAFALAHRFDLAVLARAFENPVGLRGPFPHLAATEAAKIKSG